MSLARDDHDREMLLDEKGNKGGPCKECEYCNQLHWVCFKDQSNVEPNGPDFFCVNFKQKEKRIL